MNFTADNAWVSYFHKILMTNIILDNLPKMTGTDIERQDLAGEAYFMRAFRTLLAQTSMGSLIIPLTADQDLCVPVNNEISLCRDKMMRRATTNSVVYAQMEKKI